MSINAVIISAEKLREQYKRYVLAGNWRSLGPEVKAIVDLGNPDQHRDNYFYVLWTNDPKYRLRSDSYDNVCEHNNIIASSDNLEDLKEFILVDFL